MANPTAKTRPTVFISYSHKDEVWKDEWSLNSAYSHKMENWKFGTTAGSRAETNWPPEIEKAIQNRDVAILLISADFLTSNFILKQEVPKLLQRRISEGIRVIPVILRSCAWLQVSWLKGIQARPKDGKPLASMNKSKAEIALAALAEEVIRLVPPSSANLTQDGTHFVPPENIFLAKLPQTDCTFLGREKELKLLDTAWADGGRTHILVLVAWGGVGKTALVKRWIDHIKADGWRGAHHVYGWSFYSQGTKEDRQASEDPFFAHALDWFKIEYDPKMSAWDKGRLLAETLTHERTLLILDGIEPLQYPPGPMAGELRAPGLQTLLRQFAAAGHPGLCVVTTRESIKDLEEYERTDETPTHGVVKYDLGNLSETDGAHLLYRLGVKWSGAAEIHKDDPELLQTSRDISDHALTLNLLGRFLTRAHQGDIRKRDQVKFDKADAKIQGGHAFKTMSAYEKWLTKGGEDGARELAVLRLMGLFDRPADAGCLAALRKEPAISGLTEPLGDLGEDDWNLTLSSLEQCGLISRTYAPQAETRNPELGTGLDAHPLIREYFAKQLSEKNPNAWRAAHRRLYEHLRYTTPEFPNTLEGLQPLYQAVAHGCQAGLQEDTLYKVFVTRIQRGTSSDGFYSTDKLGAFGSDLGGVACFFEQPWSRVSPALTEAEQAWLLNVVSFNLRALG